MMIMRTIRKSFDTLLAINMCRFLNSSGKKFLMEHTVKKFDISLIKVKLFREFLLTINQVKGLFK